MRGCLRCRWVLSGWIFGWWGHLVPRLGQTIAQAELRRLPGSGGSWLAWVGWHRPSRVSPQLRLRSPQLASPPSDTSRDSQFESASSKCEPPPRGWFIGRFMAQEWVYWPNNGHCSACHTKLLSVTRRAGVRRVNVFTSGKSDDLCVAFFRQSQQSECPAWAA